MSMPTDPWRMVSAMLGMVKAQQLLSQQLVALLACKNEGSWTPAHNFPVAGAETVAAGNQCEIGLDVLRDGPGNVACTDLDSEADFTPVAAPAAQKKAAKKKKKRTRKKNVPTFDTAMAEYHMQDLIKAAEKIKDQPWNQDLFLEWSKDGLPQLKLHQEQRVQYFWDLSEKWWSKLKAATKAKVHNAPTTMSSKTSCKSGSPGKYYQQNCCGYSHKWEQTIGSKHQQPLEKKQLQETIAVVKRELQQMHDESALQQTEDVEERCTDTKSVQPSFM